MQTITLPIEDDSCYKFIDPEITEDDLTKIVQDKGRYWFGK